MSMAETFTDEMGVVLMVRRHPATVTLVCMSEQRHNLGTVFSVDMREKQYRSMLREHDVPTLRGAVVVLEDGHLEVIELPEEGYRPRQSKASAGCVVTRLPTFGINRWPWGRCCCVPHPATNEQTAVTVEAIEAGHVPWWPEDQTPLEIDLAAADSEPESRAMLILPDRYCACCDQNVWVVYPEEIPDALPPDREEVEHEYVEVDKKLLRRVRWTSKRAAWRTFHDDPHNRRVIERSGLPVDKPDERQRYTHEEAFDKFNRRRQRRVFSVKRAFYAALGKRQSGTWSRLDLDRLRLIDGLRGLDLPQAVCAKCDELAGDLHVRPGDDGSDDASPANARKARDRAIEALLDDEADVLWKMLDEDEMGFGDFDELVEDVAEFAEEPLPQRDTVQPRTAPSRHLRTTVADAEAALERLRAALRGE
jgi:hypothetical protein